MTTIRQLHDSWAEQTLPKGAPLIQRQEMERAFYSGAFAIFTLQMAEIAALPDELAEAQMAAIHEELAVFFQNFPPEIFRQ